MTTIGHSHPASNGASELLESLIIGYLDSGINESEEAQLFASLAKDHSARSMLREHLVIRGAIQDLASNDLFVLSSELDSRTRAKLEAIVFAAQPASVPIPNRMADRPLVHAAPATRQLDKWKLRPQYALLLLLLAVAGTWTLSNQLNNTSGLSTAANDRTPRTTELTTDNPSEQVQQKTTNEIAEVATSAEQADVVTSPINNKSENSAPLVRHNNRSSAREIIRAPIAQQDRKLAEVIEKQEPATSSDIMISQRFARILKNTNVIAITPSDRISSGRNGGL